jgi:hypothetical protein
MEFKLLKTLTASTVCYRDSLWCSWDYSPRNGEQVSMFGRWHVPPPRHCRWRQQVAPKLWYQSMELHGVTSKTQWYWSMFAFALESSVTALKSHVNGEHLWTVTDWNNAGALFHTIKWNSRTYPDLIKYPSHNFSLWTTCVMLVHSTCRIM